MRIPRGRQYNNLVWYMTIFCITSTWCHRAYIRIPVPYWRNTHFKWIYIAAVQISASYSMKKINVGSSVFFIFIFLTILYHFFFHFNSRIHMCVDTYAKSVWFFNSCKIIAGIHMRTMILRPSPSTIYLYSGTDSYVVKLRNTVN